MQRGTFIITALRGDYNPNTGDKKVSLTQTHQDPNTGDKKVSLTQTHQDASLIDPNLIKVLNNRLALGEITIEEYYKIKEILTPLANLTSIN